MQKENKLCVIWGFLISEYEVYGHTGCDATLSGR